MTNTNDWQFLVYVRHLPAPDVKIAPPDGGWTEEAIERWLRSVRHQPGSRIFIDRRQRGGTGPFPGTTAPFLEWRAYDVGADGAAALVSEEGPTLT